MRIAVIALLLLAAACLGAQQAVVPNQWTELTSSSEKFVLEDVSSTPMHYALAVAPLAPGGAYTLMAEWSDGKGMLVLVRGPDPRARSVEAPSGASRQAVINISGGKEWRINFKADPRSTGNAGFLVFSSYQPGRKVRVLLKDPGDPDSATASVVKGSYIGSVFATPVYVTGRADFATPAVSAPAPASSAAGTLPLNQWVDLRAPVEKLSLASYPGDAQYYVVVPLRLEKGGRYTLFAQWGDGKATLLTVRGHDPALHAPSSPSGTYSLVSLNTSGGTDWRINFTVDPQSPGELGWLVFPSTSPGRAMRVMLKYPGDSDEATSAVVNGHYVGSVYKTPLHVVGSGAR